MTKHLLAALLLWSAASLSAAHVVRKMTCEQMSSPIGVEDPHPRFSWQVESKTRDYSQGAYQIEVTAEANGKHTVWNSGRVDSDASVLVPYDGLALQPAATYYWRVRTWDSRGTVSKWSTPQRFTMGLPEEADWQGARWIALDPDGRKQEGIHGLHATVSQLGDEVIGNYRQPQFRKRILVGKKLRRATAFVCGLGHFDLFLNGEKVGNHLLDPGWTLYSREALYVGFDVTQLLSRGENVVGVMLGNGFYNIPYDRQRYFKLLTTFGAPKMKFLLRLEYGDGRIEHVVSDASWRAAESPITFSSIYGGEDYDARREQKGWKNAHFIEKNGWQDALTVDCPIRLTAQMCEAVTVRSELRPVRCFRNAQGQWVYDLGQNFSGIVRMTLRSNGSHEVTLRPAELLNPDSTVNQSASGAPYYYKYTSAEQPALQTWQPQFTYYGFRYVQIEGAVPAGKENPEGLPVVERLTGIHLCNAAAEAGSFRCDNALFNQIHELIDWAVRSNMVSVLTDCPHREKLGWLEQTHLMQPSVQYRYDVASLYGSKIFRDMAVSQRQDGCIPSITPEYVRFADGFEDSPEWGSTFILSAWYHYQTYGDMAPMRRHYEGMKRYAAYLASKAENGIVDYGLGDWFDIGPRSPGRSQLTSIALTATAYLYMNLRMMKLMAHLLGHAEDEARFALEAATVRYAFNRRFVNPETLTVDRGSQTACALSLYAGLLDPEVAQAAQMQLVADIRRRGNALTAGDIGYRYVLKELAEMGRSDVIFDMNSRTDVPGYGWQLAHGATALTESWQAYGFVSNNHFMLGHLMEWLYAYLGGIRQTETSVGFRELLFDPQMVGDVHEAETTYETPYGRAACQWKRGDGKTELRVTIPPNSTARVVLHTAERSHIRLDGAPLGAGREVETQQGRSLLKLGSGTYSIQVAE